MDGILNFDKPIGWTSHDAVARVRRLARQRRVGHAGTLDPLATGVLLVCLGQATRVSEYLMETPKTYLAHLQLGVTTSTYDAEGDVTGRYPVQLDEARLQATLGQFVGEIDQVPPMYSALKHDGERLYKLARRGLEVDRPARKVHIYDIRLDQLQLPQLALLVRCSSGTYIRSLVHDIGQALGCGAYMSGLIRQGSGPFRLEQAVTAAQLEAAAAAGRLAQLLHPIDAALQSLPAVTLDVETVQRVRQGQFIRLPLAPAPACRVYAPGGALVAVMVHRAEAEAWQPDKVFPD